MKLIRKFHNAFRGLWHFFLYESNAWIHLSFALVVVILGFVFAINSFEWIALLLCIGGVLTTEAFNSALEKVCDLYSKERNPQIRIIKDISAGAVLIATLISVVVGVIIFFPYIRQFIGL